MTKPANGPSRLLSQTSSSGPMAANLLKMLISSGVDHALDSEMDSAAKIVPSVVSVTLKTSLSSGNLTGPNAVARTQTCTPSETSVTMTRTRASVARTASSATSPGTQMILTGGTLQIWPADVYPSSPRISPLEDPNVRRKTKAFVAIAVTIVVGHGPLAILRDGTQPVQCADAHLMMLASTND